MQKEVFRTLSADDARACSRRSRTVKQLTRTPGVQVTARQDKWAWHVAGLKKAAVTLMGA